MADAYFDLGTIFIGVPPEQVRPKAMSAVRKALELNPESVDAHLHLAGRKRDIVSVDTVRRLPAPGYVVPIHIAEQHRREIERKEKGSLLSAHPSKILLSERAFQGSTISFIPLSPDHCKPGFDWAAGAESILHRCPLCLSDSIIGHGWRRKQAHDDSHDWIKYRRGLCSHKLSADG